MSEISLAAARRSRLQTLFDAGDLRARMVMDLQDKPGKFFSVIQIGINLMAILGGIVGEGAFSPFFTQLLQNFLSEQSAQQIGFICSFSLVTLAFVMFADLTPKRLSLAKPESVAMFCVRPMLFLIFICAPIVFILETLSNVFLRLIGLNSEQKDKITSDDILASVSAGTNAGIIDDAEQSVIENVFNLESRPVTSAMTARESITYLLLDESTESISRKLTEFPHDRYIVCDGVLDKVVGHIDSKDILRRLIDGQSIQLHEQGLIRPIQFIPDTLTLSELLDIFQHNRGEFAVVLNEYAVVVGIVTLNDVMSTVMGDLVLTPDESQIVQRDENSWLVDGATPTIDLIHQLELDSLPEEGSYETVAGFMMYMLRKIPRRTDKIDWNSFRFEVIDVEENKINQVLVTKLSNNEVKPQDSDSSPFSKIFGNSASKSE